MYTRILVPFDGSPTSEAGVHEAVRVARMGAGTLRLIHVIEDVPYAGEATAYGSWPSDRTQAALDRGHELLRLCAARVAAQGVAVETVLVEGGGHRLQQHVAEQAADWPADLIVLGTHGRRGVQRVVLGSDAEQIVRLSEVPVLLVRHAGDAGHEAPAGTESAAAA